MEIILGSAVSLIIQALKDKLGLTTFGILTSILLLSVIAAIAHSLLISVGVWSTLKGVLLTAGAFYAFIIRNYKEAMENE